MDNEGRIKRGSQAVWWGSDSADTPEADLIDALTNIAHYAASKGLNFTNSIRIAQDHFNAEKNEKPDYLQDPDGKITCLRCDEEFVAVEDFNIHNC